ncbi:EcsC family protein [Draconibacterium halophilum]|uniref:EcsC family protein n=1 Tax=Draconibacterium halophilum TaxID=2706887 RepID=A0A6C0R812_9BACT|nr:EcsC family protein [Draconibacterium halophilum]QIA06478.1 EcsC family protein [Draconibacterium halophilum]
MDDYQKQIRTELSVWQKQMLQRPSVINWLSKKVQVKINTWIPEKIHRAITVTIKQMIRGVLFGANYTTAKPLSGVSLQAREAAIQKRIKFYQTTAAVEGGITGAGGILLGFADFPVLIGLKLKLLFDISSMYGFNVKDYKERVYILHIFELAFSSHVHRRKIYLEMIDWEKKSKDLPEDIHQFDWRNFQQEYRDYIDLAKMAQLIPFVGAPVGYLVNSRLIDKLGKTAMNAYRMRALANQ